MYDINKSLETQILSAMKNRPTIIFTNPLDPRIIEAACQITRFARMVFLASEEDVRNVIKKELPHIDPVRVDFTCSESTFVDIKKSRDLIQEFAKAFVKLPKELGFTRNRIEARKLVSKPTMFGIMAVKQGHADFVVGGTTEEPKNYFRPMLKILRVGELMLEAGLFVLPDDFTKGVFPHNIIAFGDIGVNATMTPWKLARIAVGTCVIARDLIPKDILPTIHGAIVSYSNRGSDEGPSPDLVRKATKMIPDILKERIKKGERYKTIDIEGEVKVNVAISQRSAKYHLKEQDKDFRGTNVIIAPNLELGNFLYHLYAARFPSAKKISCIFGVRFGGVDLAMDCSSEDAMLSIKANILRMQIFGHWKQTPKDTFFKRYKILAINPGSTSTKISVYEGDQEYFTQEIQHSTKELQPFAGKPITQQFNFRKDTILTALSSHALSIKDIDAISARGGLIKPIPHGTYTINKEMLKDIIEAKSGEHASNLGALIASELTRKIKLPSFIVDPVVVDEVLVRSKITGLKEIRRKVISHALSQIATARRYACETETFYEYLNLIVCHMGGGITIGAHKKGHYIDVNNGLDGEGPFSPERCGSLPTGQLINLCFSGKYTKEELKKLNKGRGGLIDLLGTSDFHQIEKLVMSKDPWAEKVFEALAYQISKNITALLPAFDGEKVTQILLTGGLARSKMLTDKIKEYVKSVGCGVTIYPGENEMLALAQGALRVLRGVENAKIYK